MGAVTAPPLPRATPVFFHINLPERQKASQLFETSTKTHLLATMGEVFIGSTPGERADLLLTHEFLLSFELAIYGQAKGCPPGGRAGLMKRCMDDAIETLMDRTHDLFHPQ